MTSAANNNVPGGTSPEPRFDYDMWNHVDGIAAFLAGTANVIMQLSLPPVGYGVVESPVDSGKVTLHPVKRLRTTLSYLAVALHGTEEERLRYREAVNQSHRQIRSRPGSPVKYNAFSPRLQLWVAACLYYGIVDMTERLHGPIPETDADALYDYCARLGTTLQMPQELWPPDRAAFDEYWRHTLAATSIDDTVRDYLAELVDLKALPLPVRALAARPQRFIATGLLPPHLRDEMRLPWSERDERILAKGLTAIGMVYRRLPHIVRRFPMNFYLWDTRRRMRKNLPLV
ncbi:oxygenase MpaB family protein [Hoyosella subflava]|uniref:ER-bound oxygenase mpaB/mpaB'/Rubber oxygenase catalytic domain-containing protein n=1 Tax=Hoyosella subflava (strain DSM 45089 / JCM 17490 / NBRC 109087 / DQS3-9A1) TaxID=443218 RepID=F6EL77_HOYSD|nr:oxygenase MpaB family protein [Hoyosella subflava]AEF39169.1 hypothetical protein AS9A_0715 [Hoyosella subflava DQS3-9A1]